MAGERESRGEKTIAAVNEKEEGLEGQRRVEEMKATRSPAEKMERKATVGLGEENGLDGGFGRKERDQAVKVATSDEVGHGEVGNSAMVARDGRGGSASSHHQ